MAKKIQLPPLRIVDINAIASHEELAARLARDPNDPAIAALRVDMRLVMHEHGVGADEAMAALFAQRKAARGKKRRTIRWAGQDSFKSGFRLLIVLVNLILVLVATFSLPEDRLTVLEAALAASLLLTAARAIGVRADIKATESAAPAVAKFVAAIGLGTVTILSLAVSAIVWAGTPGSTYAAVLRRLFHLG